MSPLLTQSGHSRCSAHVCFSPKHGDGPAAGSIPTICQSRYDPIFLSLGGKQMRRREFIGLLGGAAFGISTSTFAQQSRKTHRVGVLWHGANAEEEAIYLAALRQGLRDFGYVEGQNIVLEMRFPEEQYERFFQLANELA